MPLVDPYVREKKSRFHFTGSIQSRLIKDTIFSIDVEFPLEVDDDFWVPADPSLPTFVQPEGKPSAITGFVCMLKLNQIIAQTLRTIVCDVSIFCTTLIKLTMSPQF